MHEIVLAAALSAQAHATGNGIAHFTISDALAPPALRRRAHYFSDYTAAIVLTVDKRRVELPLSVNSPLCFPTWTSISCAVDIVVPNGSLTFAAETEDANGKPLSSASGTAVIHGKTTVPLVLRGTWATAALHLANENPVMGAPSIIRVSVSAYDADRALIIGSAPYEKPIPLYDADTSGATRLSAKVVRAPGDAIAVSYDGKSYVNATFAAGSPTGAGDELIPALRTVEYPLPSINSPNSSANGPMAVNADGSLSFIEYFRTLDRVTTTGKITERPVPSALYSIVTGPDRKLWALAQCFVTCGSGYNAIERIDTTGVTQLPVLSAESFGPLVVGSDGNFWLPGSVASQLAALRVTPAGVLTTYPVRGVQELASGVLGKDGNMWFLGAQTSIGTAFVRVTPQGKVTSFPIPPADVNAGDQVVGNTVEGPDGRVYVLESSSLLERVTTAGTVSHIAIGDVGFFDDSAPNPLGFGPDGALWISTSGTGSCDAQLERVTTSGAYAIVVIPAACSDQPFPPQQVTSFIVGPDRNLWYTRGSYVGKIVLH